MAVVAKALGDPVRLQLVDVLRKHVGQGVRVRARASCSRIAQPTLSHHLKKLRGAGIVDPSGAAVGLLFVNPEALEELRQGDRIEKVPRGGERAYAPAVRVAAEGQSMPKWPPGCCGSTICGPRGRGVRRAALSGRRAGGRHRHRGGASSGCGVPTAVADLHEGEMVLDLGSGGVSTCSFRPPRRALGPVYGVDMTDEMLELPRASGRSWSRQR